MLLNIVLLKFHLPLLPVEVTSPIEAGTRQVMGEGIGYPSPLI